MKKTLLSLCLILFCSTAGLFAHSDLQFGMNLPLFEFTGPSLMHSSALSININNHNYFGRNGTIGFSEYVSFTPFTSDLFSSFPGFNVSAFIGPSFRIPASSSTEFLLSAGFKYFLNYRGQTEEYKLDSTSEKPDFKVDRTKIFQAYALSFDLQVKFSANRKCSFVMGLPFSAGIGSEDYKESVITKKASDHYRKLSSNSGTDMYMELGLPYLMCSINF